MRRPADQAEIDRIAGMEAAQYAVASRALIANGCSGVIDDARMEVTHVIRGEDHLANTARQLLLYRALGW